MTKLNLKFHVTSFLHKNKDKSVGKTQGEIKSLLYAYRYFKKEWKDLGYTHVIKVTRRYYLENLEDWTNKTKSNRDLWTQSYCMSFPQSWISYFLSYQNSEISFATFPNCMKCFPRIRMYLWRYLYDLDDSGKYKVENTLKTKRGDNLVLEHL